MVIFSKIKYPFLYSMLVLLMISCSDDEELSHSILDKTLRVNDANRYYSLAVPENYNNNDTYPLVLALHWGGQISFQTGSDFLTIFVQPALDDCDCIIVSPTSPHPTGWTHTDTQEYLLALIDKIQQDYSIDSTKIAITGYSMGGTGTWFYAATYPDIFSVAIPVASSVSKAVLPITKLIPTYVIHGVDDSIFPLTDMKASVRNVKIYGNTIRLVEIIDAGHYETTKYEKPLRESWDWVLDKWAD